FSCSSRGRRARFPGDWSADVCSSDLVKSYFGNVVFSAKSAVNEGFIAASVECSEERKPATVTIRLPHPENKRPSKVAGGVYDPEKETITIENFSGSAQIRLDF